MTLNLLLADSGAESLKRMLLHHRDRKCQLWLPVHTCTVIFTEFLGAHVLMVLSPASLDLKVSRLSTLVASSGMLFQIRVASRKNECLTERV